jgi:hypothetical protein
VEFGAGRSDGFPKNNQGIKMIAQMLEYCGAYRAANIKNMNGREGPGFECVLLKDGRSIGTAANYGDGGMIRLYILDPKDREEFTAFAKVRHPDDNDPDWFITYLVSYWETFKSLKTKAKKTIIAVNPQDRSEPDDNGVSSSYIQFKVENTEANRAAIARKYPSYILLNEALDALDVSAVKVARRG